MPYSHTAGSFEASRMARDTSRNTESHMRHLSVALFLVAVAAYGGPEKIAIADHDGAAVVIIDASDGKELGSVSLGQDSPDRILAAPDGSRLPAVSRGPGPRPWGPP